ncbi:MAG: hypothetical protein U9N59_11345, partial [Campylobacterota bacterium]|nr:hypothetical protein [Campylobacterota bacterium]
MSKCSVCEEKSTYNGTDKCILHCEKDDLEYPEFDKAIVKYIENNNNKNKLKLRNIVFPSNHNYNHIFSLYTEIHFQSCVFNSLDFENKIDFKKIKAIQYYDCTFNENWKHFNINSITYSHCTFNKQIYLHFSYNSENTNLYLLHFSDCIFKEKFDLDFSSANMVRCLIDNINIQNTIFMQDVKISYCDIDFFIFANNTTEKITEFENDTISTLHSIYNKFKYLVSWNNTIFNEIEFKGDIYEELVLFKNTTFKWKLKLDDTIFKAEANFFNLKNEAGKKLEVKNIANRETARIIKHSFEKQDNIIEANKFYALEMKKQEKELSWTKNFADKLIFTFHQISSNHSQNWLLPILWIFSVSFFYIGYI